MNHGMPIPQNGNPYAAQVPAYVNPMAVGAQPVTYSQTPMPQMQPPAPVAAPVQQQPSEIEQQFNEWAKAKGVDVSQFEGGVSGLLDAMYDAAQQGVESQRKAATPQPAPAEPQNADVNWREYEQWLETNERGELVPKQDAPVAVPYAAVKQANEALQRVQEFRYDPEGFLQKSVASLVEQKAAEIADQRLQAFQDKQAEQQTFDTFLDRHANWIFENGDRNGKLTEYGEKYIESVKTAEEAGVQPQHVLDTAWQMFQGSFLKEQLEARHQAAQQAQAGIGPDGLYRPQQDQTQQEQPRNADGTFASYQQNNGMVPQPAPVDGNAMQQWQQAPQQPAPQIQQNPAAFQPGLQFQPTPQGDSGTPQFTATAPTPAQVQPQLPATQEPRFDSTQVAPPQQSFVQETGLGAALEPAHRSDSFADSLNGSDDFPDVEDAIRMVAERNGIDMSHN